MPGVRGGCVLITVVCACWLGGLSASAQATTGYKQSGQFDTAGSDTYGLAVDQSSSDVYVTTEGLFTPGDVERFEASGTALNTFGSDEGTSFAGVAVDPSDHGVYALDQAYHVIDAFEPSGSSLDAFDGGTASSLPVGEGRVLIASDSAGDIYYPNRPLGELQEFEPDGSPGPLTITGLSEPVDVAVAATGDIYVIDTNTSSGASQVQQFNSSGDPLGVLGAGILSAPKSIAIDSSGDVFVTDQRAEGAAAVDEFDSGGNLIRTFGAGILQDPGGIAVDSTTGEVYVAEAIFFSQGPVRIFSASSVATPTASTGSASPINPTEEQVAGTVNPEGSETTYYFEYGTTISYGRTAPAPAEEAGSGTAAVAATTTLTGLEPSQTYHYRLVATNAEGDGVYGADQILTTQPAPPSVNGESASAIASTDVMLEANVNPNNQPTSYYFQYGTSPTLSGASTAPTPPGPELGSGFGDQTAHYDIGGGLSPSTTYYYRVIATNATAPATEGTIESFTTLPPAPIADAEAASSITQTKATLNGSVTTQDAESTYHFQYVDDTDFHSTGWYTAVSAPQPEPSTAASPQTTAVATGISGLEPDTVYHVRLIATNVGGTTEGPERVFTTRAPRPGVTTGLPVSIEPTLAMVQAGVNPRGAATIYQFQYGTTTAYEASTPTVAAGASSEPQPVVTTLTGLAPGTIYHYRVIATNYSGTTEGQDETFITSVPTGSPGGVSPFGSGASTAPPSGAYQDLSTLSPVPEVKSPLPRKPLPRFAKLDRILKGCRKDKSKQKKLSCEKTARSKYGPKIRRIAKRKRT